MQARFVPEKNAKSFIFHANIVFEKKMVCLPNFFCHNGEPEDLIRGAE